MGFSLEQFLQELEEVLAHKTWDAEDKVKRLEELIEIGRKYAEECNAL